MDNTKKLDMLLHFNKVEALGRIFLEAVDYGIPLIGFNEGGIGEVSDSMGLNDMMVDGNDDLWMEQMYDEMITMHSRWTPEVYCHAADVLDNEYNPQVYTCKVEDLLRWTRVE